MRSNERECNQCGRLYVARRGVGGGSARPGDAARFPFDERTFTGVRLDTSRAHWMNGAYCSDGCYAEAYYEPPSPW